MIRQRPHKSTLAANSLRVILATGVALAMLIGGDWSLEARQAFFGQRQIQFYVPYSGATPVYLPPVLLVAHNAGNQEETARRAAGHDAAGMELDVRYVDGVLYATHSAPSSFMPKRAWQAPRLRDAWAYSSDATVLKLDLKSTGQGALDALVRFIKARPTDQQILIVSKNLNALAFIEQELPDTVQILSLSTGNDIDLLLEESGRVDGVDGVSVPQWALSPHRIEGLKSRGYLIDAWTVNDVDRLVELTSMGVDAITTDNLAFFDMAVDVAGEPDQ
jgi:glycerophosphoryl diester phosphodiesterase